MTKDLWRGVSQEHRLALMKLALGDLPKAQQEQLLSSFTKGIKRPREKSIMTERSAAKSLMLQIERAIETDWHVLYNKSPGKFRAYLEPLLAAAKKLPASKDGNVPCLLVFPHTSVPTGGRLRTIRHTCFRGNRVEFDLLNQPQDRVAAFVDMACVPATPYLAVDAQLGHEFVGSFASQVETQNQDPTFTLLEKRSRLPATIDEGLALYRLFEPLAHLWPGLRLLGTRHYDDGWAFLKVSRGKLNLDDHDFEVISNNAEEFTEFYVPHCARRIGL